MPPSTFGHNHTHGHVPAVQCRRRPAGLRLDIRLSMWVLLTVFAVALAQQPKVRRTLQKEIADYQANAEARALAAEQAAAATAAMAASKRPTPT